MEHNIIMIMIIIFYSDQTDEITILCENKI